MIVAGVVVALLILFLVANAAGFFSGPGLTQEEEETVEVPDLRGMTEDEAREELDGTGLGLTVENDPQPSNRYEEGEIMSQDPAPGDEVVAHTTITVVLSSGEEAKTTEVPNVVGRSESEAEQMIQDANLTVVHGEAQYSDNVEEGDVISSDPVAGTEVDEGTEVTIVVSLGAQPATVPNLRGMTASAAEAALADAGLSGSSSEEYSDSVPEGQIISQSIEAGQKVDKGTTVSYVVSLGPETTYVAVPGLGGYTEAQARQRLEDAGLRVGTVRQAYSNTVGAGYIIDQTASPGSSVEKGTSVGFTVSLGSDPQTQEPPAGGGTNSGNNSGTDTDTE